MREVIETGKTVEAATEKALETLGLSREEVTVEVVELPVKKLFGSKPAKVRVCVVSSEEEPLPVPPAPEKEETVKTPAAEKKPAAQAKPAPAPKAAPKKEQPLETPAEESEKVRAARAYIAEIGALMGVENMKIDAVKAGETTVLKISGGNAGALIGRRGETMESLSYLTSLAANRAGGDYEKISLDVAGYRQKREQDLAALAKRIGARVAKTGRSHMLEPMNPYERRIIHSAISEMEGVKSESTGEGADRRIVISSTDPSAPQRAARPMTGGRGGRPAGNRPSGGRGNYGSRPPRAPKPKTEYHPHEHDADAAPEAVEPRAETLNDADFIGLYGKIEL
ncbi:MAG: RNA-binding cell elongation regulator Jag/EloR [Oscillospiraceae bacterium]|nr:RNA-binding cell elongation regulator Jag/EloR [Oscillospiraceae bacterium]